MITDSEPSTWLNFRVPLGSYLGYAIALQHHQNSQYKVNITRPPCFEDWGYTDVVSDKSFSLEKREEAIEHAHELIDQMLEPILPY